MATTFLPEETEATPTEAPAGPSPKRNLPALLGWVVVVAALVLTAVFAVRALDTNDAPAPASPVAVERQSITALDHAAEQQARTQPFAETGTIAALDHAAAEPSVPWYAEHGSIAALDHEANESNQDG